MCITFIALLVRFSELTPQTQIAFDGENSEFTCSLLGGSNNVSITSEWSIELRNGSIIQISGNSSDFILLPPHDSRLIIVRHDVATFDRAIITCTGGLNFTGITAQLFFDSKYIYVPYDNG